MSRWGLEICTLPHSPPPGPFVRLSVRPSGSPVLTGDILSPNPTLLRHICSVSREGWDLMGSSASPQPEAISLRRALGDGNSETNAVALQMFGEITTKIKSLGKEFFYVGKLIKLSLDLNV